MSKIKGCLAAGLAAYVAIATVAFWFLSWDGIDYANMPQTAAMALAWPVLLVMLFIIVVASAGAGL